MEKIAKIVVKGTMISIFSLMLILPPSSTFAQTKKTIDERIDEVVAEGISVEEFENTINMTEERIERKNHIEDMVKQTSYTPEIQAFITNKLENDVEFSSQELHKDIIESLMRSQGFNGSYIQYGNGMKVTFMSRNDGGLTEKIENESVWDEFGNMSRQDTYFTKYNSDRLVEAFERIITDPLGNATTIEVTDIKHAPGSKFYASSNTRAYDIITESTTKITDPSGNIETKQFKALKWQDKHVTAYEEQINYKYLLDAASGKYQEINYSYVRDNITYQGNNAVSYHEQGTGPDGLGYDLERHDITYNSKEQTTGYFEEKTILNDDGSEREKITTQAKFEYLAVSNPYSNVEPPPDQLAKSTITAKTEIPDGSQKTETIITEYQYDGNLKLVGATGRTTFFGQEADWYHTTDSKGHTLSSKENEFGNKTYFYIDADTHKNVEVAMSEVSITLKDGNKFDGSYKTQYEILHSKPMTKQTESTTFYHPSDTNDTTHMVESTITYNNQLFEYRNGPVTSQLHKLLGTNEHKKTTYYSLGTYQDSLPYEIEDTRTDYIYTECGNLLDVSAKGNGSGLELKDSGWMKYLSDIIINYGTYLGNPYQTNYEENRRYKPANIDEENE